MNQSIQGKASIWRRAVAMYYDLLVVYTLLSPLQLLTNKAAPAVQPAWNSVRYLVILAIVWFMNVYGKSFGRWVCSIHQHTKQVDPDIYRRENFITLILGFTMIAAGCEESIGRLFQSMPITPVMGWMPPAFIDKLWLLIVGVVYIGCGIDILKLRKRGYWTGIIITVLGCVSTILNWSLHGEYMSGAYRTKLGAMTDDRVRDKVSQLLTNYPYEFASTAFLIVALFILNRKRFR